MPELDVAAIQAELDAVAAAMPSPDWAKIKIWVTGKIVECGMNGGIASYNLNGRTFSFDLQFWERMLALASSKASASAVPGGFFQVNAGFEGYGNGGYPL